MRGDLPLMLLGWVLAIGMYFLFGLSKFHLPITIIGSW